MEDSHNAVATVTLAKNPQNIESSFFGVYDGHSGSEAAKYLSQHLLENILQQDGGQDVFSEGSLTKSFLKTDELLTEVCIKEGFFPGSTCCTIFLNKVNQGAQLEVVCANVGDSRCVLCNQGQTEPMSYDHKPTNEGEKRRIFAAGGFVEFGRVNGTLAVSRAFGDITYKDNQKLPQAEQAVSAQPEIKKVVMNVDDLKKSQEPSFIIIACDGVWDVMKNEEAVQWVKGKLADHKAAGKTQPDLGLICQELLDHCVLTLDSKDNVSVIIILLQP